MRKRLQDVDDQVNLQRQRAELAESRMLQMEDELQALKAAEGGMTPPSASAGAATSPASTASTPSPHRVQADANVTPDKTEVRRLQGLLFEREKERQRLQKQLTKQHGAV